MYPDTSMPHFMLSQDYEQKKLYDKAIQEYQQGLRVQGETELAAAMGRAYAANGWRGVLQKGVDVYQKRGTNDYDPVEVAADFARLGEIYKAFFWLEKAYDEHLIPFYIKVQPAFDNIRSDPRYADLLRRMGLPQ